MGLSQSDTRSISWAAQDGRLTDLLYHLEYCTPDMLGPSSISPKRQAPIHLAASRGHAACIQALRQAGSKLNSLDKDGYSPLHLATANSHYSSVRMLLELGASVNVKNRFGITPIHIATSIGHTPCIEELIQWGADFNAQESWGQTPLIIATLKNRVEAMKLLIHRGADTNLKDHHHGNTPLHIACASKDEETILILLDAAADVMVTNAQGQSALGVALTNKAYSVVPLLLEYGAKLNKRDREHLPVRLQEYIDNLTGSPYSLLRLCRVQVRQMLGPATFNHMLPSLRLPPTLERFMQEMAAEGAWDREGSLVKEVAVQGGAEEYWQLQEDNPYP